MTDVKNNNNNDRHYGYNVRSAAHSLGTTSQDMTHRAVNKDPQKFSSNGLQTLAVVQLSKAKFILYDVVLQDDL